MERVPSSEVSKFFLVPLSDFAAILDFDGLHLYHVLATELEPLLVASGQQGFALDGVPLLRVNLLQVVLADFEGVVVDGGAGLADEHAVVHLEVSRLVSHAIDTVCIELVFGYVLPEKCF